MERKKKIKIVCTLLFIVLITAAGYCLLQKDMQSEESTNRNAVATALASATTSAVENVIAPEKQIDINIATVEELMHLPKIGEVLAKRIVAYREQTPFKVVRDIKKVSGVGDSIFETISPYICVAP
ncbi:MAG: helix-hairpin-helix domain-containing protein [Clostridia bacterium]|nr:helix-hairpin-helix domain-containing protein [Clostridia bacterium]